MTRRDLLRALLLGSLSLGAFPNAVSDASQRSDAGFIRKRLAKPVEEQFQNGYKPGLHTGRLAFYNTHTGESIKLRYLNEKGGFDAHALRRLDTFFRCPQTGGKTPISPELFLMLDAVRSRLGAGERTYLLYSGYRSPAYNRRLARRDGGVARRSYHMQGMAADIGLEGIRLSHIEKVARNLCLGGVGKYDDFVHLDVGPVRRWRS